MTTVSIELDDDQGRRLRELAAAVQKSEQDLCREALEQYLENQAASGREPSPERYAAFKKMIGLVKDGPTDSSVVHDLRPGDAS
jgi:hypothetical protein